MKAGTKLLADGVEVCLYPDAVLSAIPHKDRIAIDFGGRPLNVWYAPCKLVVKKLMSDYHGVILWSVNPVLTPVGLTHISLWLMHDNDVTDLPVGKVIQQGDPFYQEGGWGANGAKTYATHIHCNCAKGHTTQGKPNANGKYELVGSVWANDLFYLDGTERIIGTGGLEWRTYLPVISPTVSPTPIATETPSIEPTQQEDVTSPIVTPTEDVTPVLPIVEPEAPTETPVAQPIAQNPTEIGQETPIVELTEGVTQPVDIVAQPEPIEQAQEIVIIGSKEETSPIEPEPTPNPIEPVTEQPKPDEQVIEEVPNIAPKPCNEPVAPCEPVKPSLLAQIIALIIKLIVSLFKGK